MKMFKIPGINIVLLAILVLIALIISIAASIHLKIKRNMDEYIINSGKRRYTKKYRKYGIIMGIALIIMLIFGNGILKNLFQNNKKEIILI